MQPFNMLITDQIRTRVDDFTIMPNAVHLNDHPFENMLSDEFSVNQEFLTILSLV